MANKAIFVIWPILAAAFWIGNNYYPHEYLEKAFYTAIALTIIHIIFKFILDQQISKKISERKAKYAFKKITSLFYIGTFIIALVGIWSGGSQEITVAFGLVTAGIAFALQDLIKNLAGGLVIYLNKLYGVGDRIEINSKTGDVIDVGILYTTLLETREWMSGDLPTGRLTTIPNGFVISNPVNNYTKDHNYIWDEISLPIDYKSDWKFTSDTILEIVNQETLQTAKEASESITKMGEKYYLGEARTQPVIHFSLTDSQVTYKVRYPVEVRHRGIVKHKISNKILEAIKNNPEKIMIATSLLDIVGFPDINVKNKNES